jgi:LPXTG-motif cell wall-anchored protein
MTRDSPLILVIGVSALLGALIGALIVRRRSR